MIDSPCGRDGVHKHVSLDSNTVLGLDVEQKSHDVISDQLRTALDSMGQSSGGSVQFVVPVKGVDQGSALPGKASVKSDVCGDGSGQGSETSKST